MRSNLTSIFIFFLDWLWNAESFCYSHYASLSFSRVLNPCSVVSFQNKLLALMKQNIHNSPNSFNDHSQIWCSYCFLTQYRRHASFIIDLMNVNLFSKYLSVSALKFNQKLVTKLWLSLYIIQEICCHFLRKFSDLFFSVFTVDTHDFPGGPAVKFPALPLEGAQS